MQLVNSRSSTAAGTRHAARRTPRRPTVLVAATATAGAPRAVAAPAPAEAAALTQRVVADEANYILQTYARPNLVFVRGEGCKLYDAAGKEYLDMAAGERGMGRAGYRSLRAHVGS